MDPSKTLLGKTLLEDVTPLVMVLRTPLVEDVCQKNGLNFVQMLHPFCLFKKIDVPVRTASDQPYRLQMFNLRLAYGSDVRQQNFEVAEEQLKQVASLASEEALPDLLSEPPQLENVLNMAESKSVPSWFHTFNKELIHSTSFSEDETFDHPVACLFVVSSKDSQPINTFVDLFNTNRLPSLLNDGAMDPKILKYYLLVHDNQDGPSEKAINILSEMRSTFGSSDCRLLCINSVEEGVAQRDDNPWAPYKNDASLGQNIGCFLDINDLNELRDLMLDLSSKHIIPYMEQKIRVLNHQVSATRKGFRNQIKNLWWRKGKEDTPDAPSGPMYTFSSIESQIRVLGDYAFMLRDYELALANYRLLSTDYKLDKAWKRYAGVQEMIGLSYFMLDQSRKDAEYCMENAFSTYLRMGSSGQRNATRCGLWWAEMLKAWGQFKEAAGVYFRISNEEPPLHAAVMLEQSSYCYLYSNPPMMRKYGFHLVLAGSRYEICSQRKHAIRTYKNALSVYKGSVWSYINDHVQFNIGRWYSLLGIFDVAIEHMLEILACPHQPISTQEFFLKNFLHVVQNLGKMYEVFRLQLPVINMRSLNVMFEDHRTYASSDAVHIKESLWQTLEEEMVPSMSTIRTNWLDSQPRSLKKYKDFSTCVAGEPIKVDLEFRNPLQTLISVSGVSLVCELSPASAATGSGDVHANNAEEHNLETGSHESVNLSDSNTLADEREKDLGIGTSFILSELDFTLQGGETSVVQLNVTPKVEGLLKIVGVRWTFSGSIVGYCNFDSDLPKKKPTKWRNAGHSSRRNLNFVVIKNLPKLEGSIHQLPPKTYTGDLRRLALELRNKSEYSIKNLKMRISHPRFLIPGSLKDMDADFPGCLEKRMNCEHGDMQTSYLNKSNGSLFSFPKDTVIRGETTFLWPLWLHTGVSGSISLYISIYYEMENCSSEMSYRTLRMHYKLEVFPSLDISFHVTPSSSRLQEFLVRMDIINRAITESFSLRQLSAVGHQWKISSLLADVSICPSKLLLAGQTLSCFFRLKDGGKPSSSGGTTSSFSELLGCDVKLGPQENHDELLSISCSPLVDFHHQERLEQETDQDCQSTVDFVLISEPQENSDSFDPRGLSDLSQLFSHHACLCSITSKNPLRWLVDGPHIVYHDFISSFCEIKLRMTIHNCSDAVASVKIHTFDALPDRLEQSRDFSSSGGNQTVGWHDISLADDVKVLSDVQVTRRTKISPSPDVVSSFVWCAASSTRLALEPFSTTEVPLQVCVFSPGTLDLSSYELHWSLKLSDDRVSAQKDAVRRSSGTCTGHPYYLTLLQSQSP